MSEYTDNSRRRDRNRKHQGRDGRAAPRTEDTRRDRRDRKVEPRQETRPEPYIPLKLPTPKCVRCGEPIQDISSALADKESHEPIHFDCVLSFLHGAENLGENEKIVYIGQGRFAVVIFDTPGDTRKFKIQRTIEWESREARAPWRTDIAGQYSQIK